MARRKHIEDVEIIEHFEKYLQEKCSNNITLFKIPRFGDYLRNNGFPSVADTTLRRNTGFREVLAERKAKYDEEEEEYRTVITYKTIDVDSFMATNRTPNAIRTGLSELNLYYKKVAEAALEFKNSVEEIKNENEKLQDETEKLKEQIQQLLQKETSRKALETENIKLRALIKSSVYPEIANELLKEEGILQSKQQVITDEFMANNILTADSEINFHSDITNSKDDEGDIGKPKKVVAIKDLLDSRTNY
ncbi:hypothetical protein [Streptococcus sp. HMSC076C09]|jgi:hypothetical protein|uniref:hypothetical protein n=1 Tax=Streptococcus sp. HMSC076C09 TaxID=1715183 RepID=UPI0008A9775A|nr:hypothetical protein [Streptococcus sp. HMSC076C09]OHQ86575.1 hypothetical protein HMPREF2704_02095 [Streptococcus sp. HMSC076C09]